ncbi:MAG: hypothetical protein ACOYIR_04455 [Christensenellales bacterium]|jgi:hypothetical protein
MPFNLDFEESVRAIAKKLGTVAKNESDEALRDFARTAIELDLEFMERTGVNDGELYDEDAAFSHLKSGLAKKNPRLAWLAEDFSEAWEEYLDNAGYIDWD